MSPYLAEMTCLTVEYPDIYMQLMAGKFSVQLSSNLLEDFRDQITEITVSKYMQTPVGRIRFGLTSGPTIGLECVFQQGGHSPGVLKKNIGTSFFYDRMPFLVSST